VCPGDPSLQTEHGAALLVIDLDAIADNWRHLAARAAPAACAAVVKANAYGTGLEPVVQTLARAGCQTFFVAQASEGMRAREAVAALAPTARIYNFNGLDGLSLEACTRHRLRPVLASLSEAEAWLRDPCDLAAALQIDTGINRLGLSLRDAAQFARAYVDTGTRRLDLLISHFVASEIPADPHNQRQIDAFETIAAAFPKIPRSLANSSGIFLPQQPHYDLVRPGYALYGGNPVPGQKNPMRPVVQLMARILQIRTIETGMSVGYNAQWSAQRPSRLATLNVGYADGFPRVAGAIGGAARAQAIVNGCTCPLVGRVSMDLAVVDITDVPDALAPEPGQLVELIGERLGIDALAGHANRIGYEILTSLGSRFQRVYKGGG
jgi:alanine racemase